MKRETMQQTTSSGADLPRRETISTLATGSIALLALNMSTTAEASVITGNLFLYAGLSQASPLVDSGYFGAFNGLASLYFNDGNGYKFHSLSTSGSHMRGSGKILADGLGGAKKLGGGYQIGVAQSFQDSLSWGGLQGQGVGYLGVEFNIEGATHYGWLEVDILDGPLLHLLSWAYEDVADTPLSTPAIPEPGMLALLAAGATGLIGFRRVFSI
jgi:hypothetical protein